MRVLVACECSGRVREAFRAKGHDAWSCDLLPSEDDSPYHLQQDAIEVSRDYAWDLMVAHPPCTYLSRAGARWWKSPERQILADAAAEFAFALRDAPIEKIAIENPIGQLNRRWRYPDQTIHPYMFGEPYSKATCLWLKGLPQLVPTGLIKEHTPWVVSNVTARKRAGLPRSGVVNGGRDASRTFVGIANAMAEQWG
jgi:hypothetical protein